MSHFENYPLYAKHEKQINRFFNETVSKKSDTARNSMYVINILSLTYLTYSTWIPLGQYPIVIDYSTS